MSLALTALLAIVTVAPAQAGQDSVRPGQPEAAAPEAPLSRAEIAALKARRATLRAATSAAWSDGELNATERLRLTALRASLDGMRQAFLD